MTASPSSVLSPSSSGTDDPRWAAVLAREAAADGRFWYGVTTTGVFCRPSCPSRRPQPEHVRFFDSAAAAREAGFRPCLRCHPDTLADPHVALIATVCRAIEAAETPPSLQALSVLAGLSAGHLQRVFKAATGLSPRAYAAALRAGRVRAGLAAGAPVTHAVLDAGFGSTGRFYARSTQVLGMAPAAWRAGGARRCSCGRSKRRTACNRAVLTGWLGRPAYRAAISPRSSTSAVCGPLLPVLCWRPGADHGCRRHAPGCGT